MKALINLCLCSLVLSLAPGLAAREVARHSFEGGWVDVGNPTRGPMAAGVQEYDDGTWRARFTGIFEGRKFDYVVQFTGPADRLVGEARINVAKYTWSGRITRETFFGRYRSNRGHDGTFTLRRVAN